jgi:hypothetical protein
MELSFPEPGCGVWQEVTPPVSYTSGLHRNRGNNMRQRPGVPARW